MPKLPAGGRTPARNVPTPAPNVPTPARNVPTLAPNVQSSPAALGCDADSSLAAVAGSSKDATNADSSHAAPTPTSTVRAADDEFSKGVNFSSTPNTAKNTHQLYNMPNPLGYDATQNERNMHACLVNLHDLEEEILSLNEVNKVASLHINFISNFYFYFFREMVRKAKKISWK